MNSSTLKGLEIPEGKVTKIVDASGRILWTAVRMANLTITSFCDGMDGDSARITITAPSPFAPNPNEPNNKVTSWTAYVYDLFEQQNRSIKIPVGSTIECYITRDKGNADSYIKLNDVNVATGEGTYVYTVTGDATIDVSEEYIQGDFGVISITGAVTYISFSINGETYQAIEGMTWNGWFASDYNTTGKTKGDVENIKDANGNEVSLDAVIVGGTAYEVGFGSPMATVRLMSDTFVDYNYVSAYIEYKTPNGDYVSLYTAGEYELPIGTVMLFNLKYGGKDRVSMYITLNDESVASGDTDAHYEYTLTGNITIDFYNGYYNGGAIYIYEE